MLIIKTVYPKQITELKKNISRASLIKTYNSNHELYTYLQCKSKVILQLILLRLKMLFYKYSSNSEILRIV